VIKVKNREGNSMEVFKSLCVLFSSCLIVLRCLSAVSLASTPLFSEDFNDGVADGFVEAGGTWSVTDGKYVQSTTNPAGPYRSYVNALSEYVIDVDFILLSGQEAKAIYAHADGGEDYRVDFSTLYSRLTMPAWGQPSNSREFIAAVNLAYNTTYHVHVEVNLGGVMVWLNEALIHNQPWANGAPLGDGKVGVGTWSATARFDNFVVFDISGGIALFEEHFDDGRADRFTEVGDTWDVDAGSYLQFAESPQGPYRSWVAALWRYVIAVDYTPQSIGETKIVYAHADTGEEYRVDLWLNKSRLCIPEWGQAGQTRSTTLGGLDLSSYRTYKVRVEVSQAGVKVWLNKQLRHDEPWAHSYPVGDGVVGVGTYANATMFDNLAVRVPTASSRKTWYVDGAVSQSGDGASWPEAFKTIQEGIETSDHRDTVIVAAGTYYENIHFLAKNITLRSTDPLDPAVVNATIINGRAYSPAVTCQGDENENCVLSGFTITNGKSPYGGGVLAYHARPTIRHNVIFDNWGDVGGGLAFCDGPIENNTISTNKAIGGWPAGCGGGLYQCNGPIQNNVIASNTADQEGGGLSECNGDIRDNVITGNSADYGGGLADCNGPILNNGITLNSSSLNGAGLMWSEGEIRGNLIRGNMAGDGSGGLGFCDGPITGNIIIENSSRSGGGLEDCGGPIRNNIVAGNVATNAGGGLLYCDGPIENNVIVGNSTQNGGGLCNCSTTVVNCIIWGNKANPGLGPQIYDYSGTTELLNCTVEGGWTGAGDGNIALDPQFLDADGPDNNPDTFADNDYRLKTTSPCIDSGLNQPWMWGALDLDGNNRIMKGISSPTVDMGAYEYGSFRFTIVKVERIPPNQLRLTWTSRPGDTYDIFSTSGLPSQLWLWGGSVPSQGELTTWSSGSTTPLSGFFMIGIQ
jgi:hypothetical protein